ncbi:MAG: TetR/AcrR family transcriptional regulator [Spongiibacteraceae bacterium]
MSLVNLFSGAVAGVSKPSWRAFPNMAVENLSKRKPGKEALLDAAEDMFSRVGYHGASLREIAKAAGFELGLASYHFGKKDELFRQVVSRRMLDSKAMALAWLERGLASAGANVTASVVIEAYIRDRFTQLFEMGPAWSNYSKLSLHFIALEERGALIGDFRIVAQEIFDAYVNALAATMPNARREIVARGFELVRLTLAAMVIDPKTIDLLPDRSNMEEIIEGLIAFFEGGFQSVAQGVAVAPAVSVSQRNKK